MFYGRFEHKIDPKGRIQLPIELRFADEDKVYNKFILVRGIGGCLALFVKDDFQRYAEAVELSELGKKGTVEFVRQFYSRVHFVELDNQSRILVPRLLKEEAGLKETALILGAGDWIEIWDKERYEKASAESAYTYDDIAKEFFATLGRKSSSESSNAKTG